MRNFFKDIRSVKVLINESLKDYTSFRIGGKARYFVEVYNLNALMEIMKIIKENKLEYIVIGEGTNILFRDQGFDGVVIKLLGRFRRIENVKNRFICGAGVLIKNFVKIAMESGYGGAEFLAGIPGSIGGAIKGNAGAFGKAISDIILQVSILDGRLRFQRVPKERLNFDYRYSNIPDSSIILDAEFKLRKCSRKKIKERIDNYLKIRKEKQPQGFSAGSFFKNPKPLIAGRLIEECGLKGLRFGDALISEKHANFIINCGKAKAQDVIKLMNIIRKRVKEKKGIDLEPEVRII